MGGRFVAHSADPVLAILRARRRALDMTGLALARKIGTTQPALSGWETGQTTPTLVMFEAWVEALDMDLVLRAR